MKHKNFRPPVNTRELPPKVRQGEKGIQLLCPFCQQTHVIVPGQESACGTTLKVTAIQTIIPARTVRDKGLTCIKCHESGGIMVRYMGGYVHLEDCKPGTMLMTELPPFSKFAERVFKMKVGRVKAFLEKRYGHAEQIQEIDPAGNKTGKIMGYVFLKA